MDRQEELADDVQVRVRQQQVRVSDAARGGVLHGDESAVGAPLVDGIEGSGKGLARDDGRARQHLLNRGI